MAEPKTYRGGCHCGPRAIRNHDRACAGHRMQLLDLHESGALWTFVKAPQFKLLQGKDALADYQFGKKHIHHLFCQSCGVGSFSQGKAPNGEHTFAVNARCLDDVDVASLERVPFDGKGLQ